MSKKYTVNLYGKVTTYVGTCFGIEVPENATEEQIIAFVREHIKSAVDVPTDWYDDDDGMHDPKVVGMVSFDGIVKGDEGDEPDIKVILNDKGELVESLPESEAA